MAVQSHPTLRAHPGHRVLVGCLSGLALAELVTAVVAAVVGHVSFAGAVGAFTVTDGAMGLAFPVCGGLLAWHRPRNPIGWLFLAAGLGMATSAAAASLFQVAVGSGWDQGALRLLGTVMAYAWPWSIGLFLPVALLLFPDGRPAGPRWRWLVWAAAAQSVLFVLSFANPAPQVFDGRRVTLYLTIPAYHRLAPLWIAENLAWAAIFASAIASLAVRYRRGGDAERRQLLWLLLVGLVALPYVGLVWGLLGSGPILGLLVLPLIPAAVTIAILRHQLLDIRLVVSRALLYVLLTAAAIGAYAGLVALLDLTVRSRVSFGSAVVASLLVAVSFNPARVRLQRLIDRALYGDRRDPVRAVSLVGERLAGTGTSGLPGVLETLCGSLRLPFAAVRSGSAEVAAYGIAPDLLHRTALSYDGGHVGELVVGLRSGQRRLSPPDLAVLGLLAAPLAVALHATALSAALQESRIGIVAAREEERRRLRRDLHDGLGPALTGIAFKADAARNTLDRQPAQAGELLAALRADTTAAIDDIRRLVYGLRPPALDDLGLIGSLRQQSGRLGQRQDGGPATVVLDAPDGLPPLPAAVEVAAYRIVTEAMTNATRHSGGTRIEAALSLAGGGHLRIEVRDDGPGHSWAPGVGLTSMRERAAELGGSCQAGPDPAGGWRVVALLPLGEARPVAPHQPSAEVSAS
ncbi:MAG TPA: histidine kinase [Streptosporangiaceae bacterium]|nr:histidine kinase [Streptosporangiaceae bacterium]